MLTDDQKRNISNLDQGTLVEVLHICADSLGLVRPSEAMKLLGYKKRNLYYKIKSGAIKTIEISGNVFVIINS